MPFIDGTISEFDTTALELHLSKVACPLGSKIESSRARRRATGIRVVGEFRRCKC